MSNERYAHVSHLPDGLTLDSEQVVYIGRAMPRRRLKASKWANPFRIGPDGDRLTVIHKFVRYLRQPEQAHLRAALPELRGKVLACWCWPKECHAISLLAALWDLDGTRLDDVGQPTDGT